MRRVPGVVILALAGRLCAAPLPEKTSEAVIFADDRYDVVSWAGEPLATRQFFVSRGFAPLTADELSLWMSEKARAGAYGTVALLPTGLVPGPILEPGGWDAVAKGYADKQHFANSAARKYMEAGGRLVFMGDVTFYYGQGSTGPVRTVALLPQLAEVTTDQRIFYGPPSHEQVLTEQGRAWGLTQPWFGMPVNSADVTQTLVAAPTDKASLIFLKTLNPDWPLSGLLSFGIKLRADELNLALLADIYKAANYWGRPVTVPEGADATGVLLDLEVVVSLGATGKRAVYLPEEMITGLVTLLNRKGPLTGTLTVRFSDVNGTCFSLEKPLGVPAGEVPAALLAVPTKGLRRGEYRLDVAFKPEGVVAERTYGGDQTVPVTLVHKPQQPFFLGLWGQVPANAHRRQQYLNELQSYHLNPVFEGGFDDDLLRRGMQFVQRIEAYTGFPNAVDPAEHPLVVQQDASGKPVPSPWTPARMKVSLAHPQVIVGWSEGQRSQIRDLTTHPAWFPAILTCDDFSAFYGEDFGEYSTRLFQERTGQEPPRVDEKATPPPVPPKGIVPDDDLRVLWREHAVRELGGFINRHFVAAKNEVAPWAPLGPVPGGMMVPMWTEGQYPPAAFGNGGFDLLSYYYYNTYWQPEIGNLYYDEMAKMSNRGLPLWTTPDVYAAGDEPSYYRNAFFLHLAGGVSGLNYYAYSEHKPQAIREVGRLAKRLADLGPLQVALEPASKRVGLYLPFACNAMDWAYPISSLYAYSNLLCAQVEAEPVSREELLAGQLLSYEALVLWNADWLSQSEAEGLQRYLARGGKVLLDKGSAVDLPGATRLTVDLAMGQQDSSVNNDDPRIASPGQQDYNLADRVAAVREALGEYVTYESADPTVVVRPFKAAGAVYLWCVNVHTNEEYRYLVERMPVYKREKDRPVAEEEGRRFLRERGVYDEQVQTTLTLPPSMAAEALAAYDLWTGKRLALTTAADGRVVVPLTMERLGGTLLALYPSAPARASIEVFPSTVKRGEWSAADVRLYGENGRLLTGLLPCRLRVLDPQGQETWRQTLALRDGRHLLRFAPAKNDVTGTWTIELTTLIDGPTITAQVEVK